MKANSQENMINTSSSEAVEKAHRCEVKVSFPTSVQAQHAMNVLAVDPEPTNRVTKHFHILHEEDNNKKNRNCMVVRFESNELKMLRVAVSSFYDYLSLVVKTMQEFDTSMES